MIQARILLTGAGGSGGANFTASLRLIKDAKFYIVGTDARKYYLELNDGLDKKYLLPHANSTGYLTKLNILIKKERIDFLHCQSEEEVWKIANNLSKISTNTLFPKKEVLEITYNKTKSHELLVKNKIRVPKAVYLKNTSDIEKAFRLLKKKQRKVWLRAIKGGGSRASLPIYNSKQGEAWIDYWKYHQGLTLKDFMISEFLPGKEFAFQSIWYNGELITSMARERVEYLFGYLFPSGQSSSPSLARTVHREDVNRLATKTIVALDKNATGIFCVDIKENVHGQPCVTEINAGRFFTTSLNFSTAGLNMPFYYVLLGLRKKESIPKIPKYNGIPQGWYWVRMMDMGYKLVKGEKWMSKEI